MHLDLVLSAFRRRQAILDLEIDGLSLGDAAPVTSGSAEFSSLFHHNRAHVCAVSSDWDAGRLQSFSVCVVWAN